MEINNILAEDWIDLVETGSENVFWSIVEMPEQDQVVGFFRSLYNNLTEQRERSLVVEILREVRCRASCNALESIAKESKGYQEWKEAVEARIYCNTFTSLAFLKAESVRLKHLNLGKQERECDIMIDEVSRDLERSKAFKRWPYQ